MALRDRTQQMLDHIQGQRDYLENNHILFDIWEGNLRKYILDDMRRSLSANYLDKIESRIMPINILQKLVDKLAGAYKESPARNSEKEKDKTLVGEFVAAFSMDTHMNDADEFASMHKGYALEPFIDKKEERLRVIPFDRFTVMSDDSVDPLRMTTFIKFMGERLVEVSVRDRRTRSGFRTEMEMREVFFAYTDDEFHAFDDQGDDFSEALEENDGDNPYGVIPIYYANRSRYSLIPVQDTDMFSMTKIVPVLMSDLSGAILFQAFTVMFGINLNAENMTISPNAFWSFQTEPNTTKAEIGTIKPEVDIDKVLKFIVSAFTFWLDTKGIKVGAIGTMTPEQTASGIAKIIDEMDTTNIVIDSQKAFVKDEKGFWRMFSKWHNHNANNNLVDNKKKFTSDKLDVALEFKKPEPSVDRSSHSKTIDFEVGKGYLPVDSAIDELYPNIDETERQRRIDNFFELNSEPEPGDDDAATESSDKDSERVQSKGA